MAYVIPSFNLSANIWRFGHNPLTTDPDTDSVCALVYGRRVQTLAILSSRLPNEFTTPPGEVMTMDLLLPAGTDIRGTQDTVGCDIVEVPAGTGRYYWSLTVDDIGKGWPNEHRIAKIVAVLGSWVAPYA
jgi:hypothetical protein